jgi:hypothetical protein
MSFFFTVVVVLVWFYFMLVRDVEMMSSRKFREEECVECCRGKFTFKRKHVERNVHICMLTCFCCRYYSVQWALL